MDEGEYIALGITGCRAGSAISIVRVKPASACRG